MRRLSHALFAFVAVSGCAVEPESEADVARDDAAAALADGRYEISAKHSGHVLGVAGGSLDNGGKLVQWPGTGAPDQAWVLRQLPGGVSEIVNAQSQKCLDVAGFSTADGAAVQQWGCSGGDNQRFRLRDVSGGFFEIVGVQSGRCLDVSGISRQPGAPVVTWACRGGDNQKFKLRQLGGSSGRGAFETGVYRDLFQGIGKSDGEVRAKVDGAFQQLFHGDLSDQAVYFPVGGDEAYILDTGHNDVRSEGMSYGMMISVQLDKQGEFNRLWKWAKTRMQHQRSPRRGYFSWQVSPEGATIDPNSASDGEEYFATALFMAANRWGNGGGIFDYKAEAQAILDAMLHTEERNGGVVSCVTDMFDDATKQVVFTPCGDSARFTDPSYHLPAFYELWSRWATRDNAFWGQAAAASRSFFKTATSDITGLAPEYSNFDGSPKSDLAGKGDFRFDAWRVAMNIAVDYQWFQADAWQVEQTSRMLGFFAGQGIDAYVNQYTLDGQALSRGRSQGIIAMNGAAALAANSDKAGLFVQRLWDMPVPTGRYRYYDGLLYMLGLLNASGDFRVHAPR